MNYISLTATACAFALTMAFSAQAAETSPYKIIYPVDSELNDSTAYLYNNFSGDKIDSAVVKDGNVMFQGQIDDAIYAGIRVKGKKGMSSFILESGTISFHDNGGYKEAFGTELNDNMRQLNATLDSLGQAYSKEQTQEGREAIYQLYMDAIHKNTLENYDNPAGYITFISELSSMEPQEMIDYVNKFPTFANAREVKLRVDKAQKALETVPGKMMKDFTITYEGKTEKLSDYVGKGKYVLVDYWASWCGPCKRQIPVLKEILEEYGPKGLEVLGVAVWDKPEDTVQAIKDHEITWHTILNAETIPTDLYGINGIPCIILYGPDGTILSRGKQSDDLKADVKAAFDGTLKF